MSKSSHSELITGRTKGRKTSLTETFSAEKEALETLGITKMISTPNKINIASVTISIIIALVIKNNISKLPKTQTQKNLKLKTKTFSRKPL